MSEQSMMVEAIDNRLRGLEEERAALTRMRAFYTTARGSASGGAPTRSAPTDDASGTSAGARDGGPGGRRRRGRPRRARGAQGNGSVRANRSGGADGGARGARTGRGGRAGTTDAILRFVERQPGVGPTDLFDQVQRVTKSGSKRVRKTIATTAAILVANKRLAKRDGKFFPVKSSR